MGSEKIRKMFERKMGKFKSTEDAHFLCEVASTYAIFEILDELQKIAKEYLNKGVRIV